MLNDSKTKKKLDLLVYQLVGHLVLIIKSVFCEEIFYTKIIWRTNHQKKRLKTCLIINLPSIFCVSCVLENFARKLSSSHVIKRVRTSIFLPFQALEVVKFVTFGVKSYFYIFPTFFTKKIIKKNIRNRDLRERFRQISGFFDGDSINFFKSLWFYVV